MTTNLRGSPVSSSGPPLEGGDLRPSPGNSPLSDVVGGVRNARLHPRELVGVAFFDMKVVSEEQAGVGQRRNRKVPRRCTTRGRPEESIQLGEPPVSTHELDQFNELVRTRLKTNRFC